MKNDDKCPVFSLLNQDGLKVDLKSFLKKSWLVLYFYPKAMTPGCTLQAQGIRDSLVKLKKLNVTVFGISPDDPNKLKRFHDKEELNFDLLSDPNHLIAEKFNSWGEKKFMGKTYDGILRKTFIVGLDGKIKYVMDKVKTKSHHDDLLKIVKDLKA